MSRRSLPEEIERVKTFIDAAVRAGKHLDWLADHGDKKANRITADYPEEIQIRTLEKEILRRLSCKHPKERRQEVRKYGLTACVDCCQVLRPPL